MRENDRMRKDYRCRRDRRKIKKKGEERSVKMSREK